MIYCRKTNLVIALAALALACAKEPVTITSPAGEKVFTAGITTKTELVDGDNGKKDVHWKKNDNISLFDGVANREFTTTDAGPTAKFTGSASDAKTYYALYPYQAGASYEDGVFTATLPATQTAVVGSFANSLNLSVAQTTDSYLHFKNVCALVAVDLQKYFEVTSIKLEGRNNEDLAGTLSISFDTDGNPVVNSISGASKSITLSNGGAVLEEGVYYFVVAPGTYPNGFKITLTDSSSRTKEIEETASVPLARAKRKKYTVRNPYWFTRVVWGNNLGLTPAYQYANQFRAKQASDLSGLGNSGVLSPTLYDENGNVVTRANPNGGNPLTTPNSLPKRTINSNIGSFGGSGNLNFSGVTVNTTNQCGFICCIYTNGRGSLGETSVTEAVFVSYIKDDTPVTFAPFAILANPKTGGTFPTGPVLKAGLTTSSLKIDWRRSFYYYDFSGNADHVDGAPDNEYVDTFLRKLWAAYSSPSPANYGAKAPVSYYANTSDAQKAKALCYILPESYSVVVNPEKWIYAGAYANGVFTGEMTYVTDGDESKINSGSTFTPVLIWFDERF